MMQRGFGVDASVDVGVAADLAKEVESLGYGSFWVNGNPPGQALEIIDAVTSGTGLDVGVGVMALTAMPIVDVIDRLKARSMPEARIWLGVGSNRKPGALAEVREACDLIRSETDCHVVSAAVGPKMTQQAAEIADCVLFTWWPRNEVGASRQLIDEAAADAGRDVPIIASYVRCGLLPQAEQSIVEKAESYASIPRYAEVFARNRLRARDTVATGHNRDELIQRIEYEEVVIDLPIIRAITPDDSLASLVELAEACRP